MPRPKKNVVAPEQSSEELVEKLNEASEEQVVQEVEQNEKPPEQFLIPYHIRKVFTKDEIEELNASMQESPVQEPTEELDQTIEVSDEVSESTVTKFEIYSHGEYVETVEDESPELVHYLELNRAELNARIEELQQTPPDPNDLIFFNFGEQKMIYKSFSQYFVQNGFAPVEPRIKSWMQYYLLKHDPITPEEVAITLKGSLQYSFIPIK